ncbi:twin-arginine translocase subunit TatC [Halosimplex marinum]|uniref:twin-arginine translocase subunit TatC n=1 Tax=Halosimplex marinum TaxID=3396620 RepID=UPI003F5610F6
MTDERSGDGDDEGGAAGPPDEERGGDDSPDESAGPPEEPIPGGPDDPDRSDPADERRPDANPSPAPDNLPDDSGDPDDPEGGVPDDIGRPGVDDDEAPGDPAEWIDDDDDSGDGAADDADDGAAPSADPTDAAPVNTVEEGAAADGGDATEFGGDINPHANPSSGGPAEGAPAAPAGEGGLGGAPDDEEMPLARHIEEMVRRLGVVVVAMALVSGLTFPFADRLINFLWYSFLSGSPEVCPTTAPTADAACPYLFHPLALMFARLKVASLVGFVVALPVTVYESYLFMRPGLYPRERRYYLASVPTSLVLAGVGILFAYLLVLPTLFVYFTGYTAQAAEVTFSLTETFNLIVMMLGFFALVFQIPLLIMLAVMMGVTSRRWLAARRIYFWGGFATVAFLFSPDPTGMAPILVAATMIVLFEGTLLLLYWTGEAAAVTAEDLAARRPFVWSGAALVGYVVSTAPLPGSYYDQLPAAVTSALADFGVTRLTPLFVGLGLIAVYEAVLYVDRNVGGRSDAYGYLARARVGVWPLSLFVGYLGSPDPALLRRIDAVDLSTVESAGVAVGLIVTYEFVLVVLDWYENRG